ncbi:MAG: hypothetical protein NPIRA02_42440 [Nitrospirales bacterium]|nr:MAG: hypothetical protein NPIRA02_42440 [Nitrospirales bacterium]
MRKLFTHGRDIRLLGILFVISGTIDLFWIMSYPDYALKVFGHTYHGWQGAFVKYQHPIIHWAIGYGFWYRQQWAYWAYLGYLTLACLSEVTTQLIEGYHPTRMTMIIVSVLFGAYIISRKNIFQASKAYTTPHS